MKALQHFNARDLIIIAAIAALGIAVKPVISPVSKLISTPLGIPGGSLAGGFYMMWLVLAVVIVDKRYTGTVFGVLQAVLVLLVGMAGKQGAFSLVSYSLPGIVVDLLYYLFKCTDRDVCDPLLNRRRLPIHLILCTAANVTGSVVTAIFFFRLPPVLVIANILLAVASGIVGGYLSYSVFQALLRQRIIYD